MECFVLGKCEPAGSKKAVPMGRRWGVVDDNPKAGKWKESVAGVAFAAMNGEPPLEGPVQLHLTFLLARPKSHLLSDGFSLSAAGREWPCHTQRPDALKLGRAVEDALTGIAYLDDGQIVAETLAKRWTLPGEKAGVRILVGSYYAAVLAPLLVA